jgi:hypothetical protein
MATENKTTPVVIDDVEYTFEDMTDQQKIMVNHISDLDRKIGTTQFNLDQLIVGKSAFVNLLKSSLAEAPAEA